MKRILSFLLISACMYCFVVPLQSFAQKNTYNLIVGTYTKPGKSEGIYVYRFNASTGDFEYKTVVKGVINPSFLALSKDHKRVYAITETPEGGTLNAYRFDGGKSELTFLASSENKPGACHVAVNDRHAFTASYGKGSLSAFGITQPGGAPTAMKQLIQHTGSGIDKRQQSAHAHQVQFTPDGKYLTCTDLGEDKVYLYSYHPEQKEEILKVHQVVQTTPGSGPRHLTFSPNGKFAYLAQEFTGIVVAYSYKDGNLKKIQEIGTTPVGFDGKIDAADIHVTADGKFLYESNRGDTNTLTAFSIAADGELTFVETVSTQGKGPRNFAIDPTDRYVLVGHQYTNDIVIFERNKKTGTLKDTGKRIDVGAPVCLVFAPVK